MVRHTIEIPKWCAILNLQGGENGFKEIVIEKGARGIISEVCGYTSITIFEPN